MVSDDKLRWIYRKTSRDWDPDWETKPIVDFAEDQPPRRLPPWFQAITAFKNAIRERNEG